MSIKPRTGVPDLGLPTLDGGRFNLVPQRPRQFTLLLFYRGRHCPICKTYVRDLDGKLDDADGNEIVVFAHPKDLVKSSSAVAAGYLIANATGNRDHAIHGTEDVRRLRLALYRPVSTCRGRLQRSKFRPFEKLAPGFHDLLGHPPTPKASRYQRALHEFVPACLGKCGQQFLSSFVRHRHPCRNAVNESGGDDGGLFFAEPIDRIDPIPICS